MTEETGPEQGELGIARAGERLRMAREGAGLSVADIAARTRITQRHLEALERSDFDALPGRTYVTGFARAYAREIGLSETEISNEIRAELNGGAMRPRELYEAYEPADPARVPSRRLAWSLVALVVVLMAAYGIWRTLALDNGAAGGSTIIAATKDAAPADSAATGAFATPKVVATPGNGRVVLTGLGEVWIGFDDATGKTENWQTLQPGEELIVPADYIEKFSLRTAMAQKLKVTVDGRDIGMIGAADTLVKKVSLRPADLLARANASADALPVAPPPTAPAQ